MLKQDKQAIVSVLLWYSITEVTIHPWGEQLPNTTEVYLRMPNAVPDAVPDAVCDACRQGGQQTRQHSKLCTISIQQCRSPPANVTLTYHII